MGNCVLANRDCAIRGRAFGNDRVSSRTADNGPRFIVPPSADGMCFGAAGHRVRACRDFRRRAEPAGSAFGIFVVSKTRFAAPVRTECCRFGFALV
jgi:hypothetical protein